MIVPIIISVFTFLAVILVCLAIYYFLQRKENLKYQSQRLEQVINIQSQGYSSPTTEVAGENQEIDQIDLRRDKRISSIPWLDTILSRFLKERSKLLMILIEQSGLRIKAGEFLLFSLLLGFLGEMLIDIFFHIPIAGFVVGLVPFWVLNILKTKRVEAFVKQMPQALDMLSGDLRAGLDVQAGLKHLSEEFPPPLGEEFGKVVVEINLGLTLAEALRNLSTRINTIDVQILCTGIIINRELGGNLSELVGNVSNTIRERFRLKGMIKALTAENQMSGLLLIVLPFALYFLLNMIAPDTYNSFSSDPIGRKIIIGCLVSMAFGYFIMNKITKLEV